MPQKPSEKLVIESTLKIIANRNLRQSVSKALLSERNIPLVANNN